MDSSEQKFENMMGNLLRTGVITAAVLVLAGGVWFLMASGSREIAYSAFKGEPPQLRSIGGIVAGLASGDSRSLIQLGLLLLIATPIARVLFALVGFVVRKEVLFVVVTLIVLTGLLFSLIGG